jgi:hypothetical protein
MSLLPVVIALSVGTLYTVGAVVTTGQLRHANLVVRDTLPLVPLSQLLGRGMSVFLKPFAGVLAIALVFVAALIFGEWIENSLEARSRGWTQNRRTIMRLTGMLVGVSALALLSPPDVAIGVACCSLVLMLWVFDITHLRPALLLFAAAAGVMLLALSFYRPERLAKVTIQQRQGRVISGDLITTTAGTWYLGERNRNFVAVLPTDVRSVQVCSGPHSTPPLYRLLFNALRSSRRHRPHSPCT